ncbi:MAG: hypothetical protein LBH75_08220 [Treponema sp.]|nr:hypothetical protein [Treponema sp.]
MDIHIIEAKHTKNRSFPSIDDIKEGCIKMMLFSNLKKTTINGVNFNPVPILKLTAKNPVFPVNDTFLQHIIREARTNHFRLILPNGDIL